MSRGILDMLGSATMMILAIPPAVAGAELLFGGNLFVGVGLLCAAVGMVAVDQYVLTPGDFLSLVASKVAGSVFGSSDDD